MFGTFRTILAICVAFSHLGSAQGTGGLAVYLFYTLSGFLMTCIMHESYGYDRQGMKRFAVNRALRLYPQFWFFTLFSIIVILIAGAEFSKSFHGGMILPEGLGAWFANLSMLYPKLSPTSFSPRLLPATWALTVELLYYTLICFGISKTKRFTIIWLALSLAYVPLALLLNWDTYSSILAASLPFALGSFAYLVQRDYIHWCEKKLVTRTLFFLFIVMIIFTASYYAVTRDVKFLYPIAFYANILFAPVVIVLLYQLTNLSMPSKLKRLDKVIGDYSYPVYIAHWPCGLLVAYLWGGRGWLPEEMICMH
jgi:peptidoglycan/LPS O-acetylase OafA/YrhL